MRLREYTQSISLPHGLLRHKRLGGGGRQEARRNRSTRVASTNSPLAVSARCRRHPSRGMRLAQHSRHRYCRAASSVHMADGVARTTADGIMAKLSIGVGKHHLLLPGLAAAPPFALASAATRSRYSAP